MSEQCEAEPAAVTVEVPAKINISLSIGHLREDGFHDVHTLYHAVTLRDVISAVEASRFSLEISGPESGNLLADETNLAFRAAHLIASWGGRDPMVALRLTKHIPLAAGLAGGSADAAGTLVALNELWGLGLDRTQLAGLAAQLGSDVAFALYGGTAIGTGRGEKLTAVAGPRLHWVLAAAHGTLSTADVYAELDAQRRAGTAPTPLDNATEVLAALATGTATAVASVLGNDLQSAALSLAGYLGNTLRAALEAGALAAIVSGSGPTVAMLCADSNQAEQIAHQLNQTEHCRFAVAVVGGIAGATLLHGGRPDAARSDTARTVVGAPSAAVNETRR